MAQSITRVGLMLQALKQVPVQDIFERDPYESRRTALPGPKLREGLVVPQLIKNPYLRGVVTAVEDPQPRQDALGGLVARTTLATALAPYPVENMMEAWLRLKEQLGAGGEKLGKKFARLALMDASLIKLWLVAYSWAE